MRENDICFVPKLKLVNKYLSMLNTNKNIVPKSILEFTCDEYELARLNDRKIKLRLIRETDNYSDAGSYFYSIEFIDEKSTSYADTSNNYTKFFYSQDDFLISLQEIIIYEFGGLRYEGK